MAKRYDGFLFGNGLSIHLMNQLKHKLPGDMQCLLDIDAFLRELARGRLNAAEKELFRILYGGKSCHDGDFQRFKEEICRYYAHGGSSNIEYEYGKFLFLRERPSCGYDFGIVMSMFPYLYNFWYNWTYDFLMEHGCQEEIQRFYKSVRRYLTDDVRIVTTNFDRYADSVFPGISHIHGEFVRLRKLEDLNYEMDGRLEYKTIWGYNGLGKWEEIVKRRTDSRYDFSFFFDDTIRMENLLIFGLGLKRAAYISPAVSREVLGENWRQSKAYDRACMIDGHILERIHELQERGSIGHITLSYCYPKERSHMSEVIRYYGLKRVRFVPCSSFCFTICDNFSKK